MLTSRYNGNVLIAETVNKEVQERNWLPHVKQPRLDVRLLSGLVRGENMLSLFRQTLVCSSYMLASFSSEQIAWQRLFFVISELSTLFEANIHQQLATKLHVSLSPPSE